MNYPVAENFHSIQGEGVHTGTSMHFVRLAGCNVGRYDSGDPLPDASFHVRDLKLYHEKQHSICTTFDGQPFLCDTNYHKAYSMTVEEILEQTWETRICLTGGEPFLHDLDPLIEAVEASDKTLHIETSGTIPFGDVIPYSESVWITCSPKMVVGEREDQLARRATLIDNLHWVDEVKFLIGPKFDLTAIEKLLESAEPTRVFIQPINPVNECDQAAIERCLEILKTHPTWRLSAQLHKFIHQR